MKLDLKLERQAREKRGRDAERAAALWLQLKGYTILDRRVRTPVGEIDLVAERRAGGKKMLVFVEVKARQKQETALDSVTPTLRHRVQDAARLWVGRKPKLQHHLWRFDIVLLAPGRLPRHMPDAWRAER